MRARGNYWQLHRAAAPVAGASVNNQMSVATCTLPTTASEARILRLPVITVTRHPTVGISRCPAILSNFSAPPWNNCHLYNNDRTLR